MRKIKLFSDYTILFACIAGLILEFTHPCAVLEYTLGIIGTLYCLRYLIVGFLLPIKRDWILAKGKFLLKVLNFVLIVPFVITFFLHIIHYNETEGRHAGNFFFSEPPTSAPATHSKATEQETGDASSLFWNVYYHFIDPGNQHMVKSDAGRNTAAIIAILGFFFLNGLLISTLISWFDRRREQWIKGEVRYPGFLKRKKQKNHIIIGGNDMVTSIIKQIFSTSATKTPHILIQTECDVESFRRNLFSDLTEKQQKHIIIYHGSRTSKSDIKELYPHNAKEIYIIGENTRNDDIDSHHDTMNMKCLGLISEQCALHKKHQPSNRIVCRVMFEYQTTFSVFQFYDTNKEVEKTIDFEPFNPYEMWAQKVLINKELDKEKLKTHLATPDKYLPLEGIDGINKSSDEYVHLFIVGMSRMGIAMGIEAAHIAHYPNYETKKKRTRITFIDKNAQEDKNFFTGRFKELFKLSHHRYGTIDDKNNIVWDTHHPCGFDHLGGDFLDIEWEFISGGIEESAIQDYILASACPLAKITIAICLPESNRSHAAALFLSKEIYKSDAIKQILVYNRHGSSIINAITQSGDNHPYLGKLKTFGDEKENFINTFLQQSEEIGEEINNVYNNINITTQSQPLTVKYKGKSAVAIKWSSIYNGNTLWSKLRCVGYTPETKAPLTPEAIDTLADVEHNRWNIEELLMNFRPLTPQEQAEEIKTNNRNKNILKGMMAHTDICSNKKLMQIDPDARLYDIELSKHLQAIYAHLNTNKE